MSIGDVFNFLIVLGQTFMMALTWVAKVLVIALAVTMVLGFVVRLIKNLKKNKKNTSKWKT